MPPKDATLTIRGVPMHVVRTLKRMAERQHKSMEQEVRDILSLHAAERASVLKQIEESWASQARRPESSEIEAWIASGRS